VVPKSSQRQRTTRRDQRDLERRETFRLLTIGRISVRVEQVMKIATKILLMLVCFVGFGSAQELGLKDYLKRLQTVPGVNIEQKIAFLNSMGGYSERSRGPGPQWSKPPVCYSNAFVGDSASIKTRTEQSVVSGQH
jgi:hypothetical protein